MAGVMDTIAKFAGAARVRITSWMRRPLAWVMAIAAAGLLLVVWNLVKGDPNAEPYRMAAISRGAIARVVSATGALEPLVKVEVGSTVSGLVETVEVDFNSQVRAGQVLARLEPATFQQRVTQARANVAQSEAQLGVAEADYQRYVRLEQAGFASEQLMLQQRAARDSARAAVSQTRAALASAQIDLDRSVIRSPINGVVVDRQVDPGQSVAASFQAPILFIIAQDLSRLQANITVDEADIGDVRQDMPVRFTVDAYPDSQFEGRVSQVRQQGTQESGVVSYTVVVEADNPGRRLLPGMTANADIIIEEQLDVLRLPNAALRFRPADPRIESRGQAIAAEAGPQAGGATRAGGAGGERGPGGGGGGGRGIAQLAETLHLTEAQQASARQAVQQMMQAGTRPGPDMAPADRRSFGRRMREAALAAVEPSLSAEQRALLQAMQAAGPETRREVRRQAVAWVLRRGQPEPVAIEVGIADSGFTVLLGGDLEEGDEVIIGGGPAPKEQSGGPMGGEVRIRGT